MRMGSMGTDRYEESGEGGQKGQHHGVWGPRRNGGVLGLLAACGASPQVRCSGEKRKTEQCEQGQSHSLPFPFLTRKQTFVLLKTHISETVLYICI